MAGIILNGSVIKGLILNGSPVTAMLNGVKVFPAEEPAPSDEVKIGNYTWKKSNLAIDDGGEGITKVNVGIVNGYDYGTQYFYTLSAAQRIVNNISGWHISTHLEWDNLVWQIKTIEGKSLMSLRTTAGWPEGYNGTDEYGFGLLAPGDSRGRSVGTNGTYWTTTVRNTDYNDYMTVYYNEPESIPYSYTTPSGTAYYKYMSIRLVKDQ